MKGWAVCVQLTLNTGNMVLIEGDMNWCKIGYARLPLRSGVVCVHSSFRKSVAARSQPYNLEVVFSRQISE